MQRLPPASKNRLISSIFQQTNDKKYTYIIPHKTTTIVKECAKNTQVFRGLSAQIQLIFSIPTQVQSNKHCRAEMYVYRVACCPLVSHGEYAEGKTDRQTDGRTDARPLHYAFRYGCGQHNTYIHVYLRYRQPQKTKKVNSKQYKEKVNTKEMHVQKSSRKKGQSRQSRSLLHY